jgi:hypothetical protein
MDIAVSEFKIHFLIWMMADTRREEKSGMEGAWKCDAMTVPLLRECLFVSSYQACEFSVASIVPRARRA